MLGVCVRGPGVKAWSSTGLAIFREVNKEVLRTHHDALEFPDEKIVLLTLLEEGRQATVLQLPVTHEVARATEPEKARLANCPAIASGFPSLLKKKVPTRVSGLEWVDALE
jgi:hypothetical protein